MKRDIARIGIIAAVTNALSKAATTIPSETQTTIITETKKDIEDSEDDD